MARRYAVDGALAVCFAALMATALVYPVAHEWLGVAVVVLAAVHAVMHRAQLGGHARSTRTRPAGQADPLRRAARGVGYTLMAVLAVLLAAQLASAVVISRHVFWFLPALDGADAARHVHLALAYWIFVLAAFHAGFSLWPHIARRGARRLVAFRACALVLAVAGAAAFVQLDAASYLSGQVAFAAVDFTKPVAVGIVQFLLVAVLFAEAGALVRRGLSGTRPHAGNRSA